MAMSLEAIARDFGPCAAFLVFYIWDSRKQRAAIGKRLDKERDFIRENLTELITTNQEIVSENTAALQAITKKGK